MTDWTRKVRPGERLRIPAEAYNAFVDAAVAHRRGSQSQAAGMFAKSQTVIRIANVGQPIKAFEPVPLDEKQEFGGGTNNSFTQGTYDPIVTVGGSSVSGLIRATQLAVVAQTDIATNDIGYGVAEGVTWLRLASNLGVVAGQRLLLRRGNAIPSSYGSAVALGPPEGGSVFGGEVAWFVLAKVGLPSGKFLAKITGSALMSSGVARWEYEWVEVVVDPDSDTESPTPFDELTPGSWSHVSFGRALNLYEAGNSAGVAYGIPVAGNNFAINDTGVTFRPVPDGAIVEMAFAGAPQGARREVVFRAPNPVAGPCIPTAGVDYGYFEDVSIGNDGELLEGSGVGAPTGSQA